MKMNDSGKTLWYLALPVLILAACVLQQPAQAQMTSTGVDCSQIAVRHALMQDNLGAGRLLIECGVVQGGRPSLGSGVDPDMAQPPNVLVSNRTCSGSSTCTKSESMVWPDTQAGSQLVVVNYNDNTGGSCYDGISYSTNGGSTWTQISPSPLCSGHGTNYGDPLVVYNQKLGLFFAGDLVTGCGGFGVGLWSSPDGQNWTVAGCPADNDDSDRPSMWVDNNPFSARYGRMYVSFNNFDVDGGALFVSHSDDGQTWSTPVQLSTGFVREVQLTGTPPGPPPPSIFISTVFEAAMNEGGGGGAMRQNIIYRSTDGGNTFTEIMVGSPFSPAGDGICSSDSYFEQMNPIWRYMSWGQPAVGPNGVVHYAYSQKGVLSTGDIAYTRSLDNGSTWSTPIVLNDPETNQFQSHFFPSVSVNYVPGAFTQPKDVTINWIDRRQATTSCNAVTDPGCNYQVYGVQSSDNGNTWGSNFSVSDAGLIINEPAQDNPDIVACYAGDYNYVTALNNTAYVTWTDGRVSVGGVAVQNVEFEAVPEP